MISRQYLESINPDLEEHPDNFDYPSCIRKLKHLVDALQQEFTHQFSFEPIQDATFHSSVALPTQLCDDDTRPTPTIRFSNFGNFVTITGEEKVSEQSLKQITELLRNAGYVYVPFSIFGEPFEKRKRINGDLFNQLFDYL